MGISLVMAASINPGPVPSSDIQDFLSGARSVPEQVTHARRQGKEVTFVQDGKATYNWYWLMPDGTKFYNV